MWKSLYLDIEHRIAQVIQTLLPGCSAGPLNPGRRNIHAVDGISNVPKRKVTLEFAIAATNAQDSRYRPAIADKMLGAQVNPTPIVPAATGLAIESGGHHRMGQPVHRLSERALRHLIPVVSDCLRIQQYSRPLRNVQLGHQAIQHTVSGKCS